MTIDLGKKTGPLGVRLLLFVVLAAVGAWSIEPAGFPGSSVTQGSSQDAGGANILPDDLTGVGIDENLGEILPLDATFKDDAGKTVVLREYLQSGKPLLINFAYYRCPMLCNLVMNGMVKAMKSLQWSPGVDYEAITVGIDPRETPEVAAAKKASYIEELGKPGAEKGWHFLTGEEDQIRKVADKVGFSYNYDPKQDQYAHAAGIFTVSPEGKLMRYLYGIEFKSLDLRLALLDAAKGRSLSLGDKIMTFCYTYDANAKGYVLFAKNFMRGSGYAVLLVLVGLLGFYWRKEFKRKAPASQVTHTPA